MGVLVARPGEYFVGYEYHETVATGQSSAAVYIPPVAGSPISAVLRAGSNTGKIQWTSVSSASVIANTVASGDWKDWETYSEDGLSTGTLSESFVGAITGLRCVSISGAVSFDIII